MSRKKYVLTGIVLCCLFFYVSRTHGQTSQSNTSAVSITLMDAQNYAVQHSYNIKMAKDDITTAKKKIWETTAIGLPQVSGKVSYQNIFSVPSLNLGQALYVAKDQNNVPITKGSDLNQFFHDTPSLPLGVQQNTTFDLTVSQLIFSGEYLVGLQASKAYLDFSTRSETKTEIDAVDNVTKAYYLCLVVEENKNILDSSYQLINKTASEIRATYQQGLVEETDADQFDLNAATVKNALQVMTRQLETAKRLLKFQMGMDLDQDVVLTEKLGAIINKVNFEAIAPQPLDVKKNIDYKVMETNEELNRLSFRREQSKFLPTIAAFYRYERLANEPEFNFNPPNVIGLSVDIPIFSSGMRISRVQQAKLALVKSQTQKKQVEDGLHMEYETAKNDYASSLEKYLTVKDNLALAKKIYDKTIVKYRQGVSSSNDLTLIQNQYLTNQSNYFQAVYDLLSAKQRLEKVLLKN